MAKTILPSNPFAPRKYGEIQKVTEAVYIFRNITNSSFVIGDRSVAVIDTQVNQSAAQYLLNFVRSVTSKPIEFVINTHYHWDHTNGNQIFKDLGATVISSKKTKEFMVVRAPRQKEFLSGRGFELGDDPFLPEITFEDSHEIDLGGMPLRIFFAGTAETEDASAVHVVRENVLMSGDTIMTGSFPIFGQPCWDEGLEGDGRWQKTIASLLALKPKHIIPGHGPLAHEADVQKLLEIENYFVKEVGTRVQKGWKLEQILSDLEPKLPDWMKKLPVVWGTPRYAILRVWRGLTKKSQDTQPGWQQFKPSAVPSAAVNIPGKESPADFFKMAEEAEEGGDVPFRIQVLKKGSELFGKCADLLAAYAEALIDASRAEASVLEKGDFFTPARKAWEKALEIDPEHVPSLLGKGRYFTMMAYRGGDDPAAGMKLLEKARSLAEDTRSKAEAEFYLGMGFRRLGREIEAKLEFQKALSFDPSFMPARLADQAYPTSPLGRGSSG